MKKFLIAFMFTLASVTAFAEASFDQIEDLIRQKNYAAAEAGLEGIIKNHPQSSKAFYAMAQAQAGLGNLEKAQKALNIATGLNPSLDFAPADSVTKLKQAITPQVAKIEVVEESHFLRNFTYFVMFAVFGAAMYFFYSVYARKRDEEEASANAQYEAKLREVRAENKRKWQESIAQQEAERKAEEEALARLKAHPNYGHERFDPENPNKLKTVKRFKEEKAAAELREAQARAEAAEADARRARANYSQPAPTTTVVNNGSSGDFVTGMLVGNMLSGSHHHDTYHDTTIVRETVRETPAPSRDSSWDTPSTPSRSSSWDDDSSSRSSSSWSSSSDSSSSSSWSDSSSSSSSSSDW